MPFSIQFNHQSGVADTKQKKNNTPKSGKKKNYARQIKAWKFAKTIFNAMLHNQRCMSGTQIYTLCQVRRLFNASCQLLVYAVERLLPANFVVIVVVYFVNSADKQLPQQRAKRNWNLYADPAACTHTYMYVYGNSSIQQNIYIYAYTFTHALLLWQVRCINFKHTPIPMHSQNANCQQLLFLPPKSFANSRKLNGILYFIRAACSISLSLFPCTRPANAASCHSFDDTNPQSFPVCHSSANKQAVRYAAFARFSPFAPKSMPRSVGCLCVWAAMAALAALTQHCLLLDKCACFAPLSPFPC